MGVGTSAGGKIEANNENIVLSSLLLSIINQYNVMPANYAQCKRNYSILYGITSGLIAK
jgi:hypothetical protein